MFIIDAHLDLAMNAMEWNRDLRLPVEEICAREKGMNDKPDRGNAVVSLPALRQGNIGLVVATQIARYVAPGGNLPGWASPEQAWAQTQGQLAWYRAMEAEGEMVQVTDLTSLEQQVALWNNDNTHPQKPVGYILSLEGADSLVNLQYLEKAYAYGLRAIGPAHYGPGRYANGTNSSGGLNAPGKQLLKEMERLDIILDATHLCDDAFWDAMDHFNGHIWASHNNCRALVNHNRQFTDDQVRELIRHGAVIGGALDAWMMVPDWVRGQSTPRQTQCRLETLIDHLDHICQIAGNALHIGLGSDLDGAFGKEQCPYDLDTIAGLSQYEHLLAKRGYSASDIRNVLHGNWLRFLRDAWKV
ncbi:MAG TPA: membrane dipeptidase [Chitinophagaceae bacterium]|nr:membrane dipeptidase [Chitinophagaceae bacterium]